MSKPEASKTQSLEFEENDIGKNSIPEVGCGSVRKCIVRDSHKKTQKALLLTERLVEE